MKQSIDYPPPEGGVLLPLRSYTGKLRPKGVPFFRLLVYERLGILLVEVFKRARKSVIWVCEMAQRAEQVDFMTFYRTRVQNVCACAWSLFSIIKICKIFLI